MESNKRTNATAFPRVDVDPSVLTHQRQLLLAKMFRTRIEPNAHEPELNRHVAIDPFTEDELERRDRHRSKRRRWFSRALVLVLVLVLVGACISLSIIFAE